MIELRSTEQLASAIERAHRDAKNLSVQVTSTSRQYRVTNRAKGTTYTVDFFLRNGKRLGHCSCKAGTNHIACKHVAAALGLHLYIAAHGLLNRQAMRAA
jgi:uncharacterized Zn finger protein